MTKGSTHSKWHDPSKFYSIRHKNSYNNNNKTIVLGSSPIYKIRELLALLKLFQASPESPVRAPVLFPCASRCHPLSLPPELHSSTEFPEVADGLQQDHCLLSCCFAGLMLGEGENRNISDTTIPIVLSQACFFSPSICMLDILGDLRLDPSHFHGL